MNAEELIEKLGIDNLCGADLHDADLHGANLRGADLRGADLHDAYLYGANLRGAGLRSAYLYGANLHSADLRVANLVDANLIDANLIDANLHDAYLYGANLRGADLRGADLRDAHLSSANLRGADLRGAKLPDSLTVAPPSGEYVAWKKCRDSVIVKLRVPAEARRSNSTSRKCRAEFAEVLEVIGAEEGVSWYNKETVYRVGKIVYCHNWDRDRWNECGGGIHHFMTQEEAEEYYFI